MSPNQENRTCPHSFPIIAHRTAHMTSTSANVVYSNNLTKKIVANPEYTLSKHGTHKPAHTPAHTCAHTPAHIHTPGDIRTPTYITTHLTTDSLDSMNKLPGVIRPNSDSDQLKFFYKLLNQDVLGKTYKEDEEKEALKNFSITYQNERNFSGKKNKNKFNSIYKYLVTKRLSNGIWINSISKECKFRFFVCLRILLRDDSFRKSFEEYNGTCLIIEQLHSIADSYILYCEENIYCVDIIKELTNIIQKLSTDKKYCTLIIEYKALRSLVVLLTTKDVIVLHCTLHALISLAHYEFACNSIIDINAIESILTILQDYDILSKKLAATLLRLLCIEDKARKIIKYYDGIPLLLSLLHSDNVRLLWNIVWTLVHLASDIYGSENIRRMGGIPLVLSLLNDRDFVSDRTSANGNIVETPFHEDIHVSFTFNDINTKIEEVKEHTYSLKSACCACITELCTSETNCQQIFRANGIFQLSKLLLHRIDDNSSTDKQKAAYITLQANILRSLRFIFSMQQYRKYFKKLFPSKVYEAFIDIGHYKRGIELYRTLAITLSNFSKEQNMDLEISVMSLNQDKPASIVISDYEILDLLGSGAFGSVYRCHKVGTGPTYQALKEINTTNVAWGKSHQDRAKSVGATLSELSIIKEQLRHPNIVRYYKAFAKNDKLYIVMELLEGIPLGEHFNYCREKKDNIIESRVWKILIQITLALKYLHKEKKIVHRDLTPNNIMLGEEDKITITDFGLAKQKQTDCSKMTSVVGTILYSCPEIIQNQPYGPKSDIWSLGCIIYNMCALQPPFHGSNMLSLATKIVEADYEPITSEMYSEKLLLTIDKCLTSDVNERPDIIGVVALVSEKLVDFVEQSRTQQIEIEKKLQHEQKITQRNYYAANQSIQDYHRLFLVSQERYDKLINLASSGGAAGIKNEMKELDCENRMNRLQLESSDYSFGSRNKYNNIDSGHDSAGAESSQTSVSDLNSCRDRVQRSSSQPSLRNLIKPVTLGGNNRRPNTASTATLTISQDKVREINDPIQEMLHQLHKIIYISQLPPTLVQNPQRLIIERFKRALFDKQTNSFNLKNEMRKILSCSKDVIDLNYGCKSGWRPSLILHRQLSANVEGDQISDELDSDNIGITYEHLNSLIEGVLVEFGYYELKPPANIP